MNKLIDLTREQGQDYGTGLVKFNHLLKETGLFDDDKLAELIDKTPREFYMITHMNVEGKKMIWRNGDFNGLSGKEVIEAIKHGQLWLCLRGIETFSPEHHEVMEQAFGEVANVTPHVKTDRSQTHILISSPNASVLYHTDIPIIHHWHVRGKKRFYLWDEKDKTVLPDETLEAVILRETEEEIHYEKNWDEFASIIDLEPGISCTWPQNGPHKVDNLDGLNVSVVAEYFTPQAKRKYGVYYANGFMRRYLGMNPSSTSTEGPAAYAKCALALLLKKIKFAQAKEREMMLSFLLDPKKIGGIINLKQSEHKPITQL